MVEVRRSTDDPQALDEIAAALERAVSVDDSRIVVSVDDATVVLGGAVATAEQASAAALIAEELADAVRNDIRVDPLLREDPTQQDMGAGETVDDSSRRGTELATQEHGGELTTDIDESLSENIPLDPPDEPVFVPTADEQRGRMDGPAADEPSAEAGPLSAEESEQTAPSLPDMTAAELARSARGTEHDTEDR